jgi:hypothetical protein
VAIYRVLYRVRDIQNDDDDSASLRALLFLPPLSRGFLSNEEVGGDFPSVPKKR